MASVTAFNDMMSQFLVELHKTFPEEKGIKKMLTSFDVLKSTNPRMVVDGFMSGVSPYASQISAKDDKFLLEECGKIDFLKDLDLATYWMKMSANTREVTWQYLQTLYMLGTTITSLPPDQMAQIEALAQGVASKLQDEGGELNEEALMKMMGSMLGGLGK
jgi:hypothetical protein|tara:strand:- start:780 stop:1262 length:483 start_codon:yes stop_codon:yes gene_type:complete